MKILADATLPCLSSVFSSSFKLTLYNNINEIKNIIKQHDILLCRSTLPVTAELLENTSIQCVATASSGTDHIDINFLNDRKITLFDAKGSNARAVTDYIVACLALLSFQHSLRFKKVGIIGTGAVGHQVGLRLSALGYNIFFYDPPKAERDNEFVSCSWDKLVACDLICIHADLNTRQPYPSQNLFDQTRLSQLKKNTVIINAARGGIVNELALLTSNRDLYYCTDVYCQEPDISADIIQYATICTPHIAGHSIEGKQNAVIQLSKQLHDYYKLPLPTLNSRSQPLKPTQSKSNKWEDIILSLYNPEAETLSLKKAIHKKQAFLDLRKAHSFRHDFNQYHIDLQDENIQKLLGIF